MCYNNKKYCSYECVPESTIENIKTLEDRIDLENEIEELSTSYAIKIYGDSEGLFYKRQIGLS